MKPSATTPTAPVPEAAGTPGSYPLGDPRNQGQIPLADQRTAGETNLQAGAYGPTFDRTAPIGQQVETAGQQTGNYISSQVAGVPGAIADNFRNSTALARQGLGDMDANHYWPTFPSRDPATWTAGGVLKTALGGAGAISAPLTGLVQQGVEQPVTEATGSPAIGERAGLVANVAMGPLAARGLAPVRTALGDATIGSLDPETARLADLARNKYGIPVNAGQMSASPAVRFGASALNRLPFSGAGADSMAQQTAFNHAVAGTIGEDATKLTPEVMNRAKTRIGNMFDTVAQNTTINTDPKFFQDIHDTLNDAQMVLPKTEVEPLVKQVMNVIEKINPDDRTISGETYQALTRTGAPLRTLMESNNPNIAHYAGGIKDALDDAMGRSATPEMQTMLQTAKSQYRNLKTIQPIAAKADVGDISPALLRGAVNTNTGNALAFGGGGDLGDLARIGQRFLKEPPSSGTSERLSALGMLSRLGGLAGGALGAREIGLFPEMTPEAMAATALSIPASLMAGRAIGSGLRSSWLANSLINRSLRAAPQSGVAVPSALAGAGYLSSRNQPVNALAAPNP